MTNKTQEHKALVIEDSPDILINFLIWGRGKFDVAGEQYKYDCKAKREVELPKGEMPSGIRVDISTVEKMLRERPYKAILLDGHLGFGLGLDSGEEGVSDGEIVARRIRNGDYGEANRNAPLYSISSACGMFSQESGVMELAGKPHSKKDFAEDGKYGELMRILEEGQTK